MQREKYALKFVLAVLLAMFGLLPAFLSAQVDTGGVAGTVTDATGAIIAGATVTLTNPGTGILQKSQSTSTGTY
jgi:hypothetical protein